MTGPHCRKSTGDVRRIFVDECHRGYLLNRDLSDFELTFRSFDDYVSKYRRVIEYLDAVKIGTHRDTGRVIPPSGSSDS
jgi:type I site-specific restriction endonuclease